MPITFGYADSRPSATWQYDFNDIVEFDLELCSNDDKDKKKRDFGEFAVESSESDESERVRDHSILFGTLVVS